LDWAASLHTLPFLTFIFGPYFGPNGAAIWSRVVYYFALDGPAKAQAQAYWGYGLRLRASYCDPGIRRSGRLRNSNGKRMPWDMAIFPLH